MNSVVNKTRLTEKKRKQNYKMNQIEKKNKNERRQERENMVDDFYLGRFFELITSNKIYVNNLNLHEIKNEILQGYTGDFELNGKMIIGPVEHKTNIRFKNMNDFEKYINAIDNDYDSEDVTFTGYLYKLDIPHFKVVKRSTYGRGTNYMQEILEYHGRNCYIPTSGMCFIKCINYFTKKRLHRRISNFRSDPNKEDLT